MAHALAAVVASAVKATADGLLQIWPLVEKDTFLAQLLRANATALRVNAEDHLWQPDAHPLLLRAGRSIGEAGLVTAAIDYFHTLNTEAHRRLGPDHPHTLSTRHNLAHWRGEAGDAAGAATALEA